MVFKSLIYSHILNPFLFSKQDLPMQCKFYPKPANCHSNYISIIATHRPTLQRSIKNTIPIAVWSKKINFLQLLILKTQWPENHGTPEIKLS